MGEETTPHNNPPYNLGDRVDPPINNLNRKENSKEICFEKRM